MIRSMLLAAGLAALATTAAFADEKPSAAEVEKIKAALASLGCDGGEMEKESEASGVFEIDDAKCKIGGQFDIKLDKDFKLISMTRD